MFSKMYAEYTVASIFLLMTYYVMSNYTYFYKARYAERIDDTESPAEKNRLYDEYIEVESNIASWQEYALYALIITVVIGFTVYARNRYLEHKDEFSAYKFMFGVPKCRKMQNDWREKMEQMGVVIRSDADALNE